MPSLNTKLASAPNTTANYVLKATTSTTIGNSLIFDNGTSLFIGNGQSSATPQVGIIEGTDGSGTNIAGAEFRIQGGQGTGTGVGGAVTFYTAAAGSTGSSLNTAVERMRITPTGQVGIGITPTGSWGLQMYGNGSANTVARIQLQNSSTGSADSDGGGISMEGIDFVTRNNESTGVVKWELGGTERMRIAANGSVSLGSNANSADTSLLNIKQSSTSYNNGIYLERGGERNGYFMFIGGAVDSLTFRRNYFGTQSNVMSLTRDGNVLIGGTTTNMPGLYIQGDNFNGNAFRAGNFFVGAQSGGTDYPAIGYNMRFTSSSTILYEANDYASYIYFGVGRIDTYTAPGGTGGATLSATRGPYVNNGGTTWTNGSSDQRLKKNFETTQGLAEILQIHPVKYHFNWEDDSATKRLGFKAQNLQSLIPEMVQANGDKFEDGSDILTFTPDYLLPVLVKAIQDLNTKLQDQQQTINSLINR
jgi:hypothetical protein